MVQVGGPAAINGFLYQILKHLNWLASAHFTGQVCGSGVTEDACIILEPKDGGDARLDGQNMYLVEQYKTRPSRTWSVQSIINDVLPYLRMAVLEPPPEKAEYRFVTDGREGRLENFRYFLAAVQTVDQPGELEDSITYCFGTNLQKKTFRNLFDHIVNKTRRVSECKRVDEAATVFHLLKHFQMDFKVSTKSSEIQVDKWLSPMCANSGDEESKRRQLIGTLIERLSEGETRISISEVDGFLRANDLNPKSVRRMNRLDQTLRAILEREFVVAGYNAHRDVRKPPPWPTEKPILVVTGVSRWGNGGWGSGEGKTWQLLACLCEKSQANELVVWLRWERGIGAEATLIRAANVVWQEGLGFTDQKTVSALWTRYQDIAPGATIPWLLTWRLSISDILLFHGRENRCKKITTRSA
ncbi:MAG: hypothetical protein ABW068_16215, partial [Candidatus Thiodiazotropha sp.]